MASGLTWPPATLPLGSTDLVPVLSKGKLVGASATAFGNGGGGGGDGSTSVVTTYNGLRTASPGPAITQVILNDIYKGGLFVRGPANTDNGGTRINDASGQTWYRVYDERINAAWFYSAPPDAFGNPTTLGSGPTKITSTDVAANPQWIGLADDGYGGNPPSVQTAQPYPIGTYWDFVAIQEWIYACVADRSTPQSTFIGSMAGGKLTVSQWLTGPASFAVGQTISGPGVAANTIVVARTSDPNVYWTGKLINTSGLDMTTAAGNTFHGWIEGTTLTIPSYGNPSKTVTVGDQIIDPLTPPNVYFEGVWPGTTIGPQIDGTPGGVGDYNAAVAQTVASENMLGVGGPQWNLIGGNYNLNEPGFCPSGTMYLNQMLVCNGAGVDLLFASQRGTQLMWYGTATGTSNIGPGLKFNSLAYSAIRSLSLTDLSTGGVTNYLVSLSHTSGAPGLSAEKNTFYDWSLGGNYYTSQCACAVAPEGGTAQGDTQVFISCWATGFNDGFAFNGANAIAGTFFSGQTQACPHNGVSCAGGSISAYTMLTENNANWNYYSVPQRSQIHLGGADFSLQQVGTESSVIIGCRSEGLVGVIDLNRESSVMNWTCGGSISAWAPNQHWTPNSLMIVNNTVGNYTTVMMANDGGPPWFKSDPSTTTTTVVVNPSPGWTVNQWAGYGIWLLSGRNATSNGIVSNTANTLTLSVPYAASGANWYKIFGLTGPVAPNWGAVTHFGQFPRNGGGYGATMGAGFNLLQSGQALLANDWIMIPNASVFPDGTKVTQALVGTLTTQHPSSTGWYIQTFGNTANIWGTPTAPILLGTVPSATSFNFLTAQTSGTTGGAGTYTLAFGQTLGANFTGSIAGNQLTVTAVAGGSLAANQYIGGVGIASNPAPQIINAGASILGYIDDGTGGTTPGTVLTVTSILNGSVVIGAPLTATYSNQPISANTVVLNQISGTPGGVGTYHVSLSQLSPQCTFVGTNDPFAHMAVTSVTSGFLQAGQWLTGPGITSPTLLGSQISGTTGGVGSWNTNRGWNPPAAVTNASWAMAVGGQAAIFTGTIDNGAGASGHILTVTAMTSGVLGVGQTVNVPIAGGAPGLTQQLTINALGTGTGGIGTYVLGGNPILLASTTMSANTGTGVGVYGLNTSPGTIASEAMFSGFASITQPVWEVQDGWGNPINAATYQIGAFGYYSAGIPDGQVTQMVIDWDSMYGVGAIDQCELGYFFPAKVSNIGRMDTQSPPALYSQFIRPGEPYLGQFSYRNAVTYSHPPPVNQVLVSSTPFAIPINVLYQPNVYANIQQNNTVLGMPTLGPGMAVDIDLFIVPSGSGWTMSWDPASVHAATPTVNLGTSTQRTIATLKWLGSNNTSGSPGAWWVVSIQGPM